jgi:hypothetical protein
VHCFTQRLAKTDSHGTRGLACVVACHARRLVAAWGSAAYRKFNELAGASLTLADAEEEISSSLLSLTSEGGPGSFLVVSSGEIYVQFAGNVGNQRLRCEAISNQYLSDDLKLTSAGLDKLKDLGFILGGDPIENFSRTYDLPIDDYANGLAHLVLRILIEVYGVAPTAEVDVHLSLE